MNARTERYGEARRTALSLWPSADAQLASTRPILATLFTIPQTWRGFRLPQKGASSHTCRGLKIQIFGRLPKRVGGMKPLPKTGLFLRCRFSRFYSLHKTSHLDCLFRLAVFPTWKNEWRTDSVLGSWTFTKTLLKCCHHWAHTERRKDVLIKKFSNAKIYYHSDILKTGLLKSGLWKNGDSAACICLLRPRLCRCRAPYGYESRIGRRLGPKKCLNAS